MITTFHVSNYRGLKDIKISGLDRFNLILGQNNAGKSSLLEALFLLQGPTNPGLALTVSAFRGIDHFRTVPEDLWGWLFFDKRLNSKIAIESVLGRGKRKLNLFLETPDVYRVGAKTSTPRRRKNLASASTAGPPAELKMVFTDEENHTSTSRAFIRDQAMQVESGKLYTSIPTSIFVTTRATNLEENAERFSRLEEANETGPIIAALQLLEPRLERLMILFTGRGPMMHGDIGRGRLIPLPVMGEGIGRLLTILLAIASCRDGIALIDDIDAGFHHSVMVGAWSSIASVGRTYGVQIFATTHNWECCRAAHQSFAAGTPYDFKMHRLTKQGEDIIAATYDQEMIDVALETGLELR